MGTRLGSITVYRGALLEGFLHLTVGSNTGVPDRTCNHTYMHSPLSEGQRKLFTFVARLDVRIPTSQERVAWHVAGGVATTVGACSLSGLARGIRNVRYILAGDRNAATVARGGVIRAQYTSWRIPRTLA